MFMYKFLELIDKLLIFTQLSDVNFELDVLLRQLEETFVDICVWTLRKHVGFDGI